MSILDVLGPYNSEISFNQTNLPSSANTMKQKKTKQNRDSYDDKNRKKPVHQQLYRSCECVEEKQPKVKSK